MNKKTMLWAGVGVAAVIVVAVAAYFWMAAASLKSADYQAVFLTNGQVYFGKVSDRRSSYVSLDDIYYLQLKQQLQDQKKDEVQAQPDLTLIKLGQELHGPKDHMEINRDHILFIEDLGTESRVTKAIMAYREKK